MEEPIRWGLLLDSWLIEDWKYRLVNKLLGLDFLNLVSVQISGKKRTSNKLLLAHRQLDKKIFKPSHDPMELKSLEKLLANVPKKNSEDLEVLIYLGSGQADTEYWGSATFGLWSMVFFNMESQPPNLPGYREVLRKDPYAISGVRVQDPGNPKGRIIKKSWSRIDNKSFTRTQEMVYAKSISLIPRALQELYQQRALPVQLENQDIPNGKVKPNLIQIGINGIKHSSRIAKELIQKSTGRGQWYLLYSFDQNLWNSGNEFIPIYPPKHAFWADPFVVKRDGAYHIFFEELPYETNRGHISCISIHPETGEPTPAVDVLKTPYHLSYPYLFEYEEELYMIPESCENKSIELYRCKKFPDQWEFVMNLMEEVDAVDTTLFFHQGYWWLFTSIAEHSGAIHDDELSLFYADTPLSTTWTPHPQNPIISDVRKARMAGKILKEDGKLLRVGQNCSGLYGYSFSFFEIEELSPYNYRERLYEEVKPDWNPNVSRTHTYNKTNGIKVIDGYRRIKK